MIISCPKCGYTRSSYDDQNFPKDQCPKCSVFYSKVTLKRAVAIEPSKKPREKERNALYGDELTLTSVFVKAIIIILLATATWRSYISPKTMMNEFRYTIAYKDAAELDQFVNFKKLKVNIEAAVKNQLQKNVSNKLDGNPFKSFGELIASNMVNKLVDMIATPAGLKATFSNTLSNRKKEDFEYLDFKFQYQDFGHATIDNHNIIFKLQRKGLFSWELVNIVKQWNVLKKH